MPHETRTAPPGVPKAPAERTPEEWKAHFREILRKRFPEYTVREDVPVTELTGDANDVSGLYKTRPNQVYRAEWGRPYDFVLYDGDRARAVAVIGDKRSFEKVKYLIAKMFAKKLKVPYIGFYKQFANTEEYVAGRIRKELENNL